MASVASYTIVDRAAEIEPALAKLRERGGTGSDFLAVDCEGESLSRKGKLSIVSVATESHTCLFDIKTLGAEVFDRGLRDLLEDPSREKLMFDCRQDSDCLWHQFKVKLTNVLDLQLMQVIHHEAHPVPVGSSRGPRTHLKPRGFQPRLRGFFACLEIYVKDERLIRAKTEGKRRMDIDGAWMERPLDGALLAYAAADVEGFFPLYRALKRGLDGGDAMARLRVASQRYLDYLRSREVRSYDQFETNAYVPWRIVPELGHTGDYREEVLCQGCERRFPRSDFRFASQICPVCTKIQQEIGPLGLYFGSKKK